MIEIIYADIAQGAAENAAYSDTGKQTYSSLENLSNGTEGEKIATGEVGRWLLNGSVDILGAVSADYGYISAEQSDSEGNYSGEVGIDVIFTENFASSGLTITFDTHEDVEYTVKISWSNEDTLLREETVTGGDEYIIEAAVELYNKISVRFLSSSVPYRFARIEQFVFGVGRRFTPRNFDTANLNQQVNPISEEVSIDTSKFVLRPPKNVQFIFQSRQPFRIYRNNDLIASHYLDTATLTSRNKYDISCQSAIGVLDEQPFSAVMWFDKNAYEAAVEIVGEDFEVEMSDALKAKTVNGYIEDGTRRQALHQLLFAIGAICSTSGTDKVHIFEYGTAVKQIPRENIYIGQKIKQNSVITSVELEYYTWSTTQSNKAEAVEVNGVTYYGAKGFIVRQNPYIVAGTKSNPKKLSGATLLSKSQAEEIFDAVYDYHINNATITEKIVITDEQPGDKVLTEDFNGKAFEGAIISRQTVLTNLFASTIEVRGKYVTD